MNKNRNYIPIDCVNIPKILFQDEKYAGLSVDAKVLYSLLLDRLNAAGRNGWKDENGELFVIYPKSEMKKDLNATRYRVDLALAELLHTDEMVVVTQPNPGRACRIYVKDIIKNMIEKEEENAMCMMNRKLNETGKEEGCKQCKEETCKHCKEEACKQCKQCKEAPDKVICLPQDQMRGMEGILDCIEEIVNELEAFFMGAAQSGEEAACECEDTSDADDEEETASFDSYKDEAYYKLSKKNRRKRDMEVRGYLTEYGIDEAAVFGDALDFGDELGMTFCTLMDTIPDLVDGLWNYMEDLLERRKFKKLKTVIQTLNMVYLGTPEYVEDMECTSGVVEKLYLEGMLAAIEDLITVYASRKEKEKE